MNPISPDLEQHIRQILRDCGQLAEHLSTKQFEVSQKGPDDFVTSIDAALDQELLTAFSTLFPEDGIITEENAQSRRKFTADYPRLWCIDPLDGTEDFIKGRREYAVMVGLLQGQQPIAGWIYAPAHEHLYYGGPNWGLFHAIADQPATPLAILPPPPPTEDFCPVLIGHRDQARFGTAISRWIPEAHFYSLGSFGLKVMEVIQGRAGLYLYLNGRVKVWDTAGPLALAKTAGLICCDLDGQPLEFSVDAVDLDSLAHKQSILVGWADYVEALRPKLRQAIHEELQI